MCMYVCSPVFIHNPFIRWTSHWCTAEEDPRKREGCLDERLLRKLRSEGYSSVHTCLFICVFACAGRTIRVVAAAAQQPAKVVKTPGGQLTVVTKAVSTSSAEALPSLKVRLLNSGGHDVRSEDILVDVVPRQKTCRCSFGLQSD